MRGVQLALLSSMKRVVVITGGTAGVGRATARHFARKGDHVAVIARDQARLDATVAEIEACGVRGLGASADVADAEQVRAAAEQIEASLGPIDVWINGAMTTVVAPVHEMTTAEFQRVTDVCYHGFVWGTQAALDVMRPRKRGMIIQIGSALAVRSIPLQSAYCGAKHAIHGFTDSLRSELLHDKIPIDLCMVQLPAVNTPQFDWCVNKMGHALGPVPPIFQPEVIARALYAVSRHPRREVYLGWPSIKAIIGDKVAPGVADSYLATHGYSGQLVGALNQHPPANLFSPVPGDPGAHGRFDDKARSKDFIASAATTLGAAGVQAVVALAGAALVAGLALGISRLVRR
jgi:NAD(P)-dependent dehydrogenase (short-subunit alcohol dehydrogenase family)